MDYEYKSIVLVSNVSIRLSKGHNDTLNQHFNEGWEYVDSICQSFSVAVSGHKGYGSIIVVFRKKK